jgi:pimeloyl-ACP methyl ester carboxylesterase
MTSSVWYIHGASSTPRAFNWLHTKLPDHHRVDIKYGDHEVGEIVPRLLKELKHSKGPVKIIGHSLGGVIGVALALRSKRVEKVFTISSPFGGSEVASYLRWFSFDPLLSHIHPRSGLIRSLQKKKLTTPVFSIVTTSGRFPLSLVYPKNDGVVTVDSQVALAGPTYAELNLNHFEVLLAQETADYANEFLFKP